MNRNEEISQALARLEELQEVSRKRLHLLNIQRAEAGTRAEPSINIEIEVLKKEINARDEEIKQLRDELEALPPDRQPPTITHPSERPPSDVTQGRRILYSLLSLVGVLLAVIGFLLFRNGQQPASTAMSTAVSESSAIPNDAIMPTTAPTSMPAPTTALTNTPESVFSGPPLLNVFPQAENGTVTDPFINPPGTLEARFTEEADCSHSAPISLQLKYHFTEEGSGGWIVEWARAPEGYFDASQFDMLTFWVKGAAQKGFQIGIKDITDHEVKVESGDYVLVSPAEWRKVSVPLNKFADDQGPVDMSQVLNVNFGFNVNHGSGTICIDDIAFQ